MVFLDCDDDRLERRYTETRRRHPLAADHPVADGIRLERQRVWPLRDRADLVIDTSSLTAGRSEARAAGPFPRSTTRPASRIFVTSFSYRHGLPRDADLVFDMRFLQQSALCSRCCSPLSGRDREVGTYHRGRSRFRTACFQELCDWLAELLPRYEAEGKTYLTIALGCTGGRHRSVYRRRAARRAGSPERGGRVGIAHRDLDRPPNSARSPPRRPNTAVKDIA